MKPMIELPQLHLMVKIRLNLTKPRIELPQLHLMVKIRFNPCLAGHFKEHLRFNASAFGIHTLQGREWNGMGENGAGGENGVWSRQENGGIGRVVPRFVQCN